ncbi:PPK2 family polyphosphate:nucleotide phosphotransferase [Nocardioides luteus]|uniref:Polyphosphate kinase n=1 Tax=Nocardioides luteus TaxID=1844 RepID=A0ABQ5SRK4_9ACTN|nr:PPK2 family polyphosphate kinase [Nocardioides luteus]MDR7311104.1 PPK2 family polyphosphate:nucleotide phosphotransferase [Nocardioides luteus]GGR62300.1 polyphosphate kinase [Nocardioides luteus]GLJ66650.1 polyphosphate kinase [Nocardioides luteus]
MSLLDELRLPPGPVDLGAYDTDSAPGVGVDKETGKQVLAELGPTLLQLQTKLFASKEGEDPRRVLLVLQGMDTSGKGGVLKHTVGLVDPVGVRITSFKAPTDEERAQDFLWRIQNAVPEPGYLGVFDRSHYEDVLIGRVRELAPPEEIERRYGAINDFEKRLTDEGTVILKCMLHISPKEQKKRLLARLEDPAKHWKYSPGDIDERQLWDGYCEAYEIALERTNTEYAPWYLVPSDKKWYRNLAIGELLLETLDRLDLDWPAPRFDVAEEKRRLEEDTIS